MKSGASVNGNTMRSDGRGSTRLHGPLARGQGGPQLGELRVLRRLGAPRRLRLLLRPREGGVGFVGLPPTLALMLFFFFFFFFSFFSH